MKYRVAFIQIHEFFIEAEDENEAENKGYKEFKNEMCYPVANTLYDELEIECLDED